MSELYRCLEDNKIVSYDQIKRGEHAGHELKQPVKMSLLEKLLWILKKK